MHVAPVFRSCVTLVAVTATCDGDSGDGGGGGGSGVGNSDSGGPSVTGTVATASPLLNEWLFCRCFLKIIL